MQTVKKNLSALQKVPSLQREEGITLHYGLRAEILKKVIRKCLTLKIDFSANFNLTHDFFGRRLSQHPKNWKTQKLIYKYQFKGV